MHHQEKVKTLLKKERQLKMPHLEMLKTPVKKEVQAKIHQLLKQKMVIKAKIQQNKDHKVSLQLRLKMLKKERRRSLRMMTWVLQNHHLLLKSQLKVKY
jgi:hypothetical protein